jgi:hypothetical protein
LRIVEGYVFYPSTLPLERAAPLLLLERASEGIRRREGEGPMQEEERGRREERAQGTGLRDEGAGVRVGWIAAHYIRWQDN